MKRIALALLLCLSDTVAFAQGGMMPGPGTPAASGGGFQGPGDVVSGATLFHSCGRAYNAAYANGTNPLCDVVLSVGGTAACTIRVATTGFADLTGSYCVGSTTLATACTAGCSISKAYDQTGNGRDVAQATLANMPTLTLSALNSLPCATSTGLGRGLSTTGSITLAQPFSSVSVAERTGNVTTQQQLYGNGAGGAPNFSFSNAANTARLTGGTAITATASDNAFHAMQSVLNNTSSQITIDTTQGTLSAGGTSGLSSTYTFMNTTGLTAGVTGAICESGIWPVGLTGTQQTNLNTNMHSATNGWNF